MKKPSIAPFVFSASCTSVRICWHNWGCIHCEYDVAEEITSFSRRTRLLAIKQYNAMKSLLSVCEIQLTKQEMEDLLMLADEIERESDGQDYHLPVCDGYCWTMTFFHKERKIHKIEGTVDAPQAAKKLKSYIHDLCVRYERQGQRYF